MLADDLTGACDAAVAFALRGFRTAVLPAGVSDGPAAGPAGFEMTVLPTFSRDAPAEAARAKVEEACRVLARGGIRLIYKKIDSTLKGNLAAEIDAVLACGGFSSGVVSPAFPAMGRTVAGGVLQVGGEPTSLHVPSLLAAVPLARSRDAGSDQDLRELAAEAIAGDGRVLCVGSGGLAAQLAALLAGRFERTASAHALPGNRGPALFVIGSEQPATRAQVDYLMRNRSARGLHLAEVDPGSAAKALREGRHLVVTADPAKSNGAEAGRLLALTAGHVARGLVVSGGDTAEWISRAAQVTTIEIKGEVLRGIPWGEAVTRSGQRWCMVTKAGGFGAEDALAIAADFLMGESSKSAA
jgi:uncharacterized protein YgbK (DUF1537 family)